MNKLFTEKSFFDIYMLYMPPLIKGDGHTLNLQGEVGEANCKWG